MFRKIIYNYILYSFCFFLSLFLHRGAIFPLGNYDLYYGAFIASWAVSGLLARKYNIPKEFWLLGKVYNKTVSFFLMLGILTFVIYKFDLTGVSRFVILNSLIIAFAMEIAFIIITNSEKFNYSSFNLIYSSKAFIFELLLFGAVNLFIIFKLEGNISFDDRNLLLFLSFYLSWFLGSFLGHQFHPRYRSKMYWVFIWQYLKSYIIILALVLFNAFINRLTLADIIIITYGIIFYSAISFLGISTYYQIKMHRILASNISGYRLKGESGDINLIGKMPDSSNQYRSSFNPDDSELLHSKFKNFSLRRYPELYEFLKKSIDLGSFNYSASEIIKSNNISNIDFLPSGGLQLLLNLERLNNVQNIDEYLIEVNSKLLHDGIFSGNFETIYLRHQNYLKRYPYYLAQVFYLIDFIWNRAFSKMLLSKNLYVRFMGGTYKAISLAEGLGRLYFSGFEILQLKVISDRVFFIAKKIGEPFLDKSPSTGLIFKMDRIGKNGKIIQIYKFRTMHPYSEFIQHFVYGLNGSENGDKITDDFRVAFWGKIFRKYWLDELPMLINLFRGDVKIMGVRPLSCSKFALYPQDLQKLRISTKPGLIPPFYADIPKTFNDLLESERRYLQSYIKNPIKTEIRYFFKCTYNILFRRVRSS